METRDTMYAKSVAEIIKKKDSTIKRRLDMVDRLEKVVQSMRGYCNIHLEVDRYTEYGPDVNVILEPNDEMVKEVEGLIEKRKNSGPHIYFNSGDDWRNYLNKKKELAPLMLSTSTSYTAYSYNERTKKVIIPMWECGAKD